MPDLTVVERQGAVSETTFPYRSGLLTFREAPVLLLAFARLKTRPDVVMLDGQGVAHPRRIGLAAHVGLWLGLPALGCAKTRLTGKHPPVGEEPGSQAPLTDRGEVIGRVVRTKRRSNPVYVSVGNRIDLDSAVRVVLATCRGYRIPEPTRQAHLHVNDLRRQGQQP
jgi:deoxyribonuclease V